MYSRLLTECVKGGTGSKSAISLVSGNDCDSLRRLRGGAMPPILHNCSRNGRLSLTQSGGIFADMSDIVDGTLLHRGSIEISGSVAASTPFLSRKLGMVGCRG